MRRRMGRAIALLLCCALLLGGALSTTGTAATVYLMAVNDTVVEMTPANMPVSVGGVLYVPYTLFANRSGINLGVAAQYSATKGTVLVSSDRKGVVFDPRADTAYDFDNRDVGVRAVVRNGLVFIPVAWVCSYFGQTSYSLTRTQYGTLVRVTSNTAILTDAEFVDAADGLLRANWEGYQQAVAGAGQDPDVQPSPSPGTEAGPLVCLALRLGDQTEEAARQLESYGQRGLFLMTPEELAEQDDLVRRLVGMGHTVGIALTGADGESCLTQAEQGGVLLAHAARYDARIVCADQLDQEGREALERAGYVVWQANVQGEQTQSAGVLLGALRSSRANYVQLTCDQQGVDTLTAALYELTAGGYRLRQATAPLLGGE